MNTTTEKAEKQTPKTKEQAIAQFVKDNSTRFFTMEYTNLKGERSIYVCQSIPSYESTYQRSLNKVNKMRPKDDLGKAAREAVIKSLKESLEKGIGNNSAYTQREVKKEKDENLRILENGQIKLLVRVIRKKIIKPSLEEKKKVNSSPITIAKNKIRKKIPTGQIREFNLNAEQVHKISARGMRLELA